MYYIDIMNMNKQINITGALLVLALIVGILYWVSIDNKRGGVVKVAIAQTTSHIAYDQLVQGVKHGFSKAGYKEGENVIFDLQNGQGDVNTNKAIANKFAKDDNVIIIPLGTQASQAAANTVKNKPVIFGSVADPMAAKLIASYERPGGNVTGTSELTPYRLQLELFKQILPNMKTVGILYNPSEANSQSGLNQIKGLINELGLQIVVVPVNNTNEIYSAAKSIADKVDAYYVPADNTVLAGQDTLIKVSLEKKKPMFAFDSSGVEHGALVSVGTNYEKMGIKTANMAIRVLQGQDPATFPVQGLNADDQDLYLNQKTANLLGITFSPELLSKAKQVYK